MLFGWYDEYFADECKIAARREGSTGMEGIANPRQQCALYKEELLIKNSRDRSDCKVVYQFDLFLWVRGGRE